MTEQEIANYRKARYETTQKLIRVAIQGMTDEKKGRLTTRGVIATLQDAIDYLEKSALNTKPEDYLGKPKSKQQPLFDKKKFLETAKTVSPSTWEWSEVGNFHALFLVIAESLSSALTEGRKQEDVSEGNSVVH